MFNKVVANVQQSGCKCSTKGLQMIKYNKHKHSQDEKNIEKKQEKK